MKVPTRSMSRGEASDHAYFVRRERQERRCAEDMSDPLAAAIHRRLAALYAERIHLLEQNEGG